MSSFSVIYDACVLYPAPLRDLLMRLALKDLFRARWTEQILDEMEGAILRQRTDLSSQKLQRTRALMNQHVRDALVSDYEQLIPVFELPDPDDRHVLAAAIRSGAQVIVTYNRKDFPDEVLGKWGIEVEHPDDFIEHLLSLHQAVVLETVREQRLALKNPPKSPDELFESFLNQQRTKTVAILQAFATLI